MAFGFRSVNAATGSVQLDETYRNLVFVAKATLTTTAHPQDNHQLYSVGMASGFSFLDSTALAAVSGGSVVPDRFFFYSSPHRMAPMFTRGIAVKAPVGSQVTGYAFRLSQDPAVTGFGIKILDSAGNLCYHSKDPPMAVAAVVKGDYVSSGGTIPAPFLTGGRNYALNFFTRHGRYHMDKGGLIAGGQQRSWDQDQYGAGVSLIGSSWVSEPESAMRYVNDYDTLRFSNGSPSVTRDYVNRQYAIVVVDVTGL